MTPRRRWCVVAVLAMLVVATPFVPRLLPVNDPDTSAADLLAQVQQSEDSAYEGYVETSGRVQLAVGERYSDLADLFGGPSRLRVWWDGPQAWRVDRLKLGGEDDLVHARDRTTTYDYEEARAVTTRDPSLRLPRTVDVVPPSMARIALAGASDDEVRRLPARRVAGIAAPGLRYSPASSRTTIDHVDVWVAPGTGVVLRLEATSRGAASPDFTTVFEEFTGGRPDAGDVTFDPSRQVQRDVEDAFDLVDAANQYAPLRPPDEIAGLARSVIGTTGLGAVGVYGVGVERVIAVPLRDREADPLRAALRTSPGATAVALELPTSSTTGGPGASSFSVPATVLALGPLGPLGVIVTGADGDDAWLVAGTVTAATLQQAASDLVYRTRYVSRSR